MGLLPLPHSAYVSADTLKGKRDRAILATLLYHGLHREELCKLRVCDLQQCEGVLHFRVHGKGDKTRYIPGGPQSAAAHLCV